MARIRRMIRGKRMAGSLSLRESETKRKLALAQGDSELTPVNAALAQGLQRRCEIAFREAPPVAMGDEWMVEVNGLGQAEQHLQQTLDRRRGSQVGAAHDHA